MIRRMTRFLASGVVRGLATTLMVLAATASFSGESLGGDAGRSSRVPWTGSKIVGTPEPPSPYAVEPAFPRLKPRFPVVLVRAGGTERLFLGELQGRISSFPDDPDCDRTDLALDLAKVHPDFSALYGLTFHPRFEENRYLYVCYVLKNGLPDGSVVARFTMSRTDPPVIDPRSERVILRFWSGGHNGGCLDFGNDGYLYISTGDGTDPAPPDSLNTGQDCSDLLSSILRVDVDHPEPGKGYRVPPDNPFAGMSGVRPEIWAFGFRNPWKMSIDHATGDLWVGDVGWELWEMIFKVKRGGNYGWSIMEGPQPVNVEGRRGPGPIVPPLKVHPHSEAASMTGGYVYHGTRFPELAGAYIYGDYQTGTVWSLRVRGDTVVEHKELARTPLHLVAFGENRQGELYLLDHDRTGQIYRLVRNPAATARSDFPRRLSQTGLFASTRDQRPAPGVIPYSVNAELWADGATAERFLAVPGEGRIRLDERGNWRFPEGSVLVRTVFVAGDDRPAGGPRRVETQLLHFQDNAWRPYSYVWDDDQADAVLADAAGMIRKISVGGPGQGGGLARDYRVHARAECILCHNPWVEAKTLVYGFQSASPLGVNTPQLNRMRDEGGRPVNQLRRLHELGLLSWTPEPERSPRLVDPYDDSAEPGQRARSYLQTNCAHCHQFNAGGTANIALGFEVPLDGTKTVNVRPIQGTFQIAGARIIAPGDPSRSVLYYRVSKLGGGRMPRVGSNEVDVRAVRMLHDWIAGMPASEKAPAKGHAAIPAEDRTALESLRRGDRSPADVRSTAILRLLSSTRGALLLLDLVDRGPEAAGRGEQAGRSRSSPHSSLPTPHLTSLRREAVMMAKQSPAVEVRDLFERFIPREERAKRLGDVADRRAILSLRGDAGRGRAVFADNPAAQCKTCHRTGDIGQAVGPDLTKIGSKYDRAAMLEQILEPSRTIEPQYTTYLVETKDGQVLTGLVAEKSAREVVLKDAQGKTVRIPGGDVERLVPQARSLMPDLLLRDLTAQQVADLLEYLGTLR
jgi:uncharacterized repeat protein (TIGR03806 family)